MSATQFLTPASQQNVNTRNGKSGDLSPAFTTGLPKQNGRKLKPDEAPAKPNGMMPPATIKENASTPSSGALAETSTAVEEKLEAANAITTTASGTPAGTSTDLVVIPDAGSGEHESAMKNEDEEKPLIELTPEVIVNYTSEEKAVVFQDQHGSIFAWIPVTDCGRIHFECLKIPSRAFLARLLELIRTRTNSMPKLSDLKQAIEILQLGSYRTAKKNLANRRATEGDETFIDLGDPNWNMIRMSCDRWVVEAQKEPRFFRPQHMLALPEPVSGGNLDDLFDFIPAETDEEKLLLKTWLLGGLYASIPNPILILVGQQGSAKTTRSRRIRSLLDPSITPVLGDLETANLFLTFQHHAVPTFENVSSFNRKMADMFCRAVTGNGVERRKLYTDSDQVLYSFRRPIIINGIDTPSTRPDFLDRCLILNCRRMEKFTTLETLDREFEAARPKLFGAMLDLLVKTLKALPTTPAATEFRMADFARFGRAVAIASGQKAEDFDKAYRLNIQQQDFEILEDAPMAKLLERFAAKYTKKPWEGTAEELLMKLKEVAHVMGDATARNDLPQSARWLSSRLGELAPALATRKVCISKQPRTNAKRLWMVSSTIIPDPNAEPDDIFDALEAAGDEESRK